MKTSDIAFYMKLINDLIHGLDGSQAAIGLMIWVWSNKCFD
mgnify:CR=1 FL=1